MLTVSPTAAEAIRMLADSVEAPQSAGVRISAAESTPEGTTLALALVEAPQPDDEVVAEGDTAVFVEPQIARYLDGAILDAQVSETGVAFSLRDNHASGNGDRP